MLETGDLLLKEADAAFAAELSAYYLRNRSFFAPFEPLREDDYYTEAYQRKELLADQARWQKGEGFRFYIFHREDDRLIGIVGLNNIIRGCFQSCFIGYKLDEQYINRGYMTQAVNAVVQFGFNELKLHRIEGSVLPENARSLRVLEKCGFVREGYSPKYLRINGEWRGHVHMVLLNDAV